MKAALVSVIAVIAASVIIVAAVFALSSGDDDKDTITVTMSWEKSLVEDIAGDDYKVVSMTGSGFSPHDTYTLPSNVSDLYKSKIYFKIGTGVEWETAFLDSVSGSIPSGVKIVSIGDGIPYDPLPNMHHHDHEEGDHEEHEGAHDAHIWTSPDILRKTAKLIAGEFSALNPHRASFYEKNLSDFSKRADAVDSLMESVAEAAGPGHVHVMVWHPAWQYLLEQYAERFGADFHMESAEEDGEVTPAEAAAMVKDEGCSSIYVSVTDEGYEGRKALEEAGITVHVVNPTADDMLKSAAEFLLFLKSDLEA